MSIAENKAVFLSYASQDAVAARRICEALRAAGVEVWFDQSELRGGDAWDQKIRKQIKECALFVPIVSANTQARTEGYFRLEWRLADQRTHLMGKSKAFLVPVCIDDTRDGEADVPDSFLAAQWMRLPTGEATPAFAERIRHLLSGEVGARTSPSASVSMAGETPALPAKRERARHALVFVGVLAVGALAIWRPWEATPAAATGKIENRPPSSSAPTLLTGKSIAVLPFENMSEDRDANAFFADGIHEDILTNLALIKDLRVVSRTSVMQYRGQQKPVPQIARELGVSYILEGSVRRAGKQVRVSGKLIKVATDEPVWANAYNRDSTDALTIQAGVAMEIAGALRSVLSPGEKAALEQRATRNLEAYDLLLKAREIKNGPIGVHLQNLPKVQRLLERAVELDPKFASAWVELVFVRAMRFHAGDGNDRRNPVHRASALAALETAQRLTPDAVDIVKARGELLYRCDRDFAGAAKEWEKIPRLYPNDPEGWYSMAIAFRRLGRWPEAVENFRRVAQLDPANLRNLEDLKGTLLAGRRYDEALTVSRRVVALGSVDHLEFAYEHARVPFLATGSTKELDALFSGLAPQQQENSKDRWILREHAILRGIQEEALRLTDEPWPEGRRGFARARDDALVFAAAENRAAVAERAGRVMAELTKSIEQQPNDALLRSYAAALHAFLGHRDEARAHAQRMTELIPEKDDAMWGAQYSIYRATILAWAGDKDEAIAELIRLIRVPYGSKVNLMRTSFWYHPLRGDPRFERLLADPKNNAPLF